MIERKNKMEFNVWIYCLFTEILIAITPEPAIVLVTSQSLKYGTKSSFFSSFGVSRRNLLYFFLSACGVGTIILAAGNLVHYIKICGAIYLIFTGLIMFYKSFKARAAVSYEHKSKQNNTKSFIQGFIAETSNSKAIIFFVALIPMFIDESKNVALQFTIMDAYL